MIYVFDSSFAGALVIPDETNKQVTRMYNKIENEDEKYTPRLFWYEIANVFKNLIRRKRFTADQVMGFYPRLAAFGLMSDNADGADYSQKLLELCNEYNLSSYDAAYLELAGRKKAVLCTLDENLQKAAKRFGVTTLK
jgi:predicted nucleic acid-binding protein